MGLFCCLNTLRATHVEITTNVRPTGSIPCPPKGAVSDGSQKRVYSLAIPSVRGLNSNPFHSSSLVNNDILLSSAVPLFCDGICCYKLYKYSRKTGGLKIKRVLRV
jgi:hypothetical protein